MESKSVQVNDLSFSNDEQITIIAGPCQMESMQHSMDMAGALKEIADKLGFGLVYKTSYDKANRTSLNAQRGFGLEDSKAVFDRIKADFGLSTLTDVHSEDQAREIAPHVDILQIPAFLCRQTDLLVAAAKTGKCINVKKGQFLAPWDMKNVANKLLESGNDRVLLTERGTSFGYNTLVSDMRGLDIMAKENGLPIVFDATHSVQQPGGLGGASGGKREFVPVLARAAVAVGVAGVFMEVHQDPDNAPSDGPNMVKLQDFEGLMETLLAFDQVRKSRAV